MGLLLSGWPPYKNTMASCCDYDTFNLGPTRLKFSSSADATCVVDLILCEVTHQVQSNGDVVFTDGRSSITFTEDELTALGLTIADVGAAIDENCANTPPDPPIIDTETTCVVENENVYLICVDKADPANPVITVKDLSGNDVTGTVTPTVCEGSLETVETCFQDDTEAKYYRREIFRVGSNPLISYTYWVYPDGSISETAPTVALSSCIEGCEEVGSVGTISNWAALKS